MQQPMQIDSEWNDEGLYKDIFVEAPFACFSIGIDGRIRAANKQALALVGYRLSEVLGRPVFDLYADTPAGKPKAEEQFRQFRLGSEVRATELQMHRSDGTSVWIGLSVKPIRDRTGRVAASCSVVEEITTQLSPLGLSQFQQDRDRAAAWNILQAGLRQAGGQPVTEGRVVPIVAGGVRADCSSAIGIERTSRGSQAVSSSRNHRTVTMTDSNIESRGPCQPHRQEPPPLLEGTASSSKHET